jgi:formylglycine-generating enzyme required for sulfatase activity
LPTEAEWEKAARGTDDRVYPWNDSINCGIANYKNACVGDTVEVGSYLDISPYGVYDMAGNVSEWVNDWYDWTGYYGLLSSLSNPFGPNSGDSRVVRGGSWNGAADQSRTTFRHGWYEHVASEDGGFRCALTP